MDSWWETPLCSGFLKNIADEIWSGHIVLVFLPRHTPNGFILELKHEFGKRDIYSFNRIDLNLCDVNDPHPIESILHLHFQLNELETFVGRRVIEIFNSREVVNSQVIIFENLSDSLVGKFKEFLEEYRRFAIKKNSSSRHKILVILDPNRFKSTDFASEAGISKIFFEGVFDKLDHFLGLRFYLGFDKGLTTPLLENLITSLSQFDFKLSESICDCPNLFNDYPTFLKNYAEQNEWSSVKYKPVNQITDDDFWDRWAKGIVDKKNGEIIYHTAYLAIHGKNSEIEKRIWQAGVEILLPMVENIRQKILNCSKLMFPFKFYNQHTGELKEDKLNFEIGEIFFLWRKSEIQFKGLSRVEREHLYSIIILCKTIRDDLAHLKVPHGEDITEFYKEYNSIDSLLE